MDFGNNTLGMTGAIQAGTELCIEAIEMSILIVRSIEAKEISILTEIPTYLPTTDAL